MFADADDYLPDKEILGMKWRWYLLMSVGIKILVSCRVDERLSDTGLRKK